MRPSASSRLRRSTGARPRPYPERLAEPWYDAWHAVRRVRTDGSIKWGGDLVFIRKR